MSLDGRSPHEYLVGHIEDALARDPRVNEQGLHVEVKLDPSGVPTIVVRGTVVSAPHKNAVAEVIAELLPGQAILDETTTAEFPESGEIEEVT